MYVSKADRSVHLTGDGSGGGTRSGTFDHKAGEDFWVYCGLLRDSRTISREAELILPLFGNKNVWECDGEVRLEKRRRRGTIKNQEPVQPRLAAFMVQVRRTENYATVTKSTCNSGFRACLPLCPNWKAQ